MSIVTRGLGDPSAIVTRGLGAGISVLEGRGGVIVTPAEYTPTDLAIIEELVTSVEEALAPVVEEFLTEEGLEIMVSSAATLEISDSVAPALDIGCSEEVVEVGLSSEAVIELMADENLTLNVSVNDWLPIEVQIDEVEGTIIDTDDDNSGNFGVG